MLRALIAVAIAAALTAFASSRLPRPLDASTDVVGYPIAFYFNVDRYLWVYGLWVAFFPIVALGIDIALARLTRGRVPRADWDLELPPREPPGRSAGPVVATIRTAFVGAVLGLEASIALGLEGVAFVLTGLGVLGLYAAVAGSATPLVAYMRAGTATFWERLATVNLVGACLTVLGLHHVSEATEIRVLATGNLYEYSWFPLWSAAALTTILLAFLLVGARRAASGDALFTLERRSLLLVPAPVLLLLVLARLPGELGTLDFFHEGEPLAAAHLTAEGAVPWRDLMFIHGLLHDVLAPWLGFSIFGDTRWGYIAGMTMLLVPLYWISQYFLCVYLFGRNILFLAGTQIAVVLGLNRDHHIRFLLMPLVLLLVAAVLRKPSWTRSTALAAVLTGQVVLSPETLIAVPACLAALGLFELFAYDRQRPLLANFRRTFRTAAAGAFSIGLLFVVLGALRILDDFLFFYRTFFSDHTLTGGIPIAWAETRFSVAVFAPVVLVILAVWFFGTARRARWSPAIDDWVMAALAVTVLLYYPKFLARADFHVFQVFAVSVPLLMYAIYRVVTAIEDYAAPRRRNRVPTRHWITAAAVFLVVVLSPATLLDTAEAIPERTTAQANYEQFPPRFGYMNPLATDLNIVPDLERIFDRYLGPDGDVFDFSNNPMVFHYLLDRRPSTRYFHVSMAIRQHTQSDLVKQLERRKPKLVVFSSSAMFGLPSWDDISNQVRHYDVSNYILDHYRPLLSSHSFFLMARNGAGLAPPSVFSSQLKERLTTDQLYFRTLPCDWGYAPNFLTTGPSSRDASEGVELLPRPTTGVVTVKGWAVDLDAQALPQQVVAAVGTRVVAQVAPSIERPDIADRLENQKFLRSGFTMIIPGTVPFPEVRIYGLTRAGTARELIYERDSGLAPTSSTPERIRLDERSLPVVAGRTHGEVESTIPLKRTWALELPAGTSPRDYDWLEVRSRARLTVDALGVTDNRGDAERAITFRTLDRGRRSVKVQVGACSQWHGLDSRLLYLESVGGQEISGVRLIP